jgi:hypothetical protein
VLIWGGGEAEYFLQRNGKRLPRRANQLAVIPEDEPVAAKFICRAAEMDKFRQRESLLACALLFACDTRPIVDGGSLILRRRLGTAFMPSWEVGSFVGRENCCALRRESARRAASPSSFLASNFWRRASSLLTRFKAAAKTCLRWRECSAVPEVL